MKKVFMLLLLMFLLLSSGCVQQKQLSDLQIQACTTADQAGACSTRLEEVGIVTKEDCCEVLGKCCG